MLEFQDFRKGFGFDWKAISCYFTPAVHAVLFSKKSVPTVSGLLTSLLKMMKGPWL